MPHGTHEMSMNVPIFSVFSFVSDMDNWAPLINGYVEHKKLNEKQSTWKFKGDLGIIQKTIYMGVEITEWKEPTLITFDLVGLNENFKGNGYFQATPINQSKTNVTSSLNITAKGFKAPVANPVLKSLVPKTTMELTKAIEKKLASYQRLALT
ncbi:SRPBCC family protein [Virgibacillus sp. LDC-1]|uniref:SRPBCC family protein n=1 Tax=Virgibacillus sp. LDC-1 TaxID=3039856 RepID=UPI0024DEC783|nr:SRPBCC family protein [Virgibacillus sp. LDC-1]